MSSFSRQQLEKWLSGIEVKGKVLGVGDSQNPTRGRTKTWEAEEYKILDLPVPHQTKVKPDIVADINKLLIVSNTQGVILPENYYDIVFCTEVMEYIWNPYIALTNINYTLKKGGILYISFHYLYEIHPPVDQDYLRYTPLGAVRLLTEAGFEIVEAVNREFEYPENAQKLYNGEGMRGKKDLYNVQGVLIKAKKI